MDELKRILENDPYCKYLGIRIEEVAKGFSRVSAEIKGEMINFLGLSHGGFVFSLADAAFAAACNSHGIRAVAAQVSIHFMAPAVPGERIIAEAREEKITKKLGFYTIQVRNEKGDPLAMCQAIAFRTSSPLTEKG